MTFWLAKSEADVFSIDDLKRDGVTAWDCVRNYEARNNLRAMKKGDSVLYYHSNSDPSGIVGVARVVKEAYPEPIQFDKKSDYYDPKATLEAPRWSSPDLKFSQKFKTVITLEQLRKVPELAKMRLLQKGSRLSVLPVTEAEFEAILRLSTVRISS